MVDSQELRKDDVVLFKACAIDPTDRSNVSGIVNKILKDHIIVHWYSHLTFGVDTMVLVDKNDIFPFPIGDNLNLDNIKGLKYKGLTKEGECSWEYKGKVIKYRHELQNALWDNGIECWPKGTCDEEKEVEL